MNIEKSFGGGNTSPIIASASKVIDDKHVTVKFHEDGSITQSSYPVSGFSCGTPLIR